MNLGEITARMHRERNEGTRIRQTPDGELEGQLLFEWCLAGVQLEELTSCNKMKMVYKGLHVYQMMMQYVARDDSGLSLARRKNATCFLRWIMSVISDGVIQSCYQRPTKNRALEKRVSSIVLNVYKNAGVEKDDD